MRLALEAESELLIRLPFVLVELIDERARVVAVMMDQNTHTHTKSKPHVGIYIFTWHTSVSAWLYLLSFSMCVCVIQCIGFNVEKNGMMSSKRAF